MITQECSILLHLFFEGPATATVLQISAGLPSGTFFNLIKRLCEKGLINSSASERDRRLRIYSLAPDVFDLIVDRLAKLECIQNIGDVSFPAHARGSRYRN
jgi:DNA-binding MarR family transcriptional regulator